MHGVFIESVREKSITAAAEGLTLFVCGGEKGAQQKLYTAKQNCSEVPLHPGGGEGLPLCTTHDKKNNNLKETVVAKAFVVHSRKGWSDQLLSH